MKTMALMSGLMQVAGGLALGVVAAQMSSLVLVALVAVCGMVNAVNGTCATMEALFGNDGLICDLFGRIEDDKAK